MSFPEPTSKRRATWSSDASRMELQSGEKKEELTQVEVPGMVRMQMPLVASQMRASKSRAAVATSWTKRGELRRRDENASEDLEDRFRH